MDIMTNRQFCGVIKLIISLIERGATADELVEHLKALLDKDEQ